MSDIAELINRVANDQQYRDREFLKATRENSLLCLLQRDYREALGEVEMLKLFAVLLHFENDRLREAMALRAPLIKIDG